MTTYLRLAVIFIYHVILIKETGSNATIFVTMGHGELGGRAAITCSFPSIDNVRGIEWRSKPGANEQTVFQDPRHGSGQRGPTGRWHGRHINGSYQLNFKRHKVDIFETIAEDEAAYQCILTTTDWKKHKAKGNLKLMILPEATPAIKDSKATKLSDVDCSDASVIPIDWVPNAKIKKQYVCATDVSKPRPSAEWVVTGTKCAPKMYREEYQHETKHGIQVFSVTKKLDITPQTDCLLKCTVSVPDISSGKARLTDICLHARRTGSSSAPRLLCGILWTVLLFILIDCAHLLANL